jgi:hypothetical protein
LVYSPLSIYRIEKASKKWLSKIDMGHIFSYNTPMVRINEKTVRYKAFQELKTFQDALKIADVHVKGDTTIVLLKDNRREHTTANERFYFVNGISVDNKNVYIEKLYGKTSKL